MFGSRGLFNSLRRTVRSVAVAKSTASPFRIASAVAPRRHLSGKAPGSFYDEEAEAALEVNDIQEASSRGGVEFLTRGFVRLTDKKQKVEAGLTINELESFIELNGEDTEETMENADDDFGEEGEGDEDKDIKGSPLDGFGNATRLYLPPEALNTSVNWKHREEVDEDEADPEELKSFVSKTDVSSQPFDKQGLVHCTGKKQRSGKAGVLRCHMLDLQELNYMDVVTLKRFLSADSEIMGKRLTGLCSKCQRKVAKAVRRARSLGLLTHIGGFKIVDADPANDSNEYNYHATVEGVDPVVSKTII